MDNKTLLAIILSIAVIIGYQFLFPPPQQPVVKPPQPVTEKKVETPEPVLVPVAPGTTSAPEKEIKIENELYSAVLSSKGGTIKSWAIKAYKDKKGQDVILLKKPGVLPAVGIGTNDSFDLANVNFSISGADLRLDSNKNSGTVVFEYSHEGVSVKRTYTFYSDTYKVDISDEVAGLPEYRISLGSDFGIYEGDASSAHVGPILLTGTDLKELNPKKLKEPNIFKENLKWIAQEDKYFFAALVPVTPVEEARAWTYKDSPVIAFKSKASVNKFVLYAGPKEQKRLEKLNIGLEHIINYGFFSIIARPLFWVLILFYGFFGNYGWAIILLTIVTRIPFIPLLNKGQKSMRKLQDIQPKMAEIREKYKKDPPKMQQEMTGLYKKHKVNPVGGCLPMLLQIPVFFALYKVLLIAIELRGAPFMLWIVDLSAKDPYYVLPIVMGITMVIQQKMTPSTMDPKQAKLMMLMPVVFTFMFLSFASGLVLYWLINNILGIIQQFFVNKKLAKQSV
ncbi:MAG: preprotein translocase YidC [Nitrospira bacterium HGW-Nitrospira-1]|nr:MAG: preprotein translocase YidC [Nitrospira bacterium HGW-Nitrospira-1]